MKLGILQRRPPLERFTRRLLGVDGAGMRAALREGRSLSLRRRRLIAALAAVGLVDAAIISLYQMGAIRRLPDLPGRFFDANAVSASLPAYLFGAPDAALGALNLALDLVLAGWGGVRATGRRPIVGMLLGANVLAGALAAIGYFGDMVFREKKLCVYCLLATGACLGMLAPAALEVREELRAMRP